jgi:uncharacterized protein
MKAFVKRTRASIQDDDKIDAPESSYLYIAPSQLPNAGSGLYTVTNMYKEEIISLYKGKILTPEQVNKIAEKNEDQYFIAMLDGTIMDSMHVKCFAKYANDAEGFPNARFKNNSKIAITDNNEVCLVATRNIKAGEEIFCAYGRRYWKKHANLGKKTVAKVSDTPQKKLDSKQKNKKKAKKK